jgi:WD40 repeat protein
MAPIDDHHTRALMADEPGCTIEGVAWSPNSARLATAGESSGVTIWRVADGARLLVYPGSGALGWSPDGSHIASVNGGVDVWNPETGERLLTYASDGHVPEALAWSPDGARIASTGAERIEGGWIPTVQIWNPHTGERLLTYRGYADMWTLDPFLFDPINTLSWSPDSTRIVTGSGNTNQRLQEASVHIFDTQTGERLIKRTEEKSNYAPVVAVGWSPDGSRIASTANFRTVEVWDAATGDRVCIFQEHRDTVQALAWSPDGARIASADWDGAVLVWESTTARRVDTYDGHYFGNEVYSGQPRPERTRLRHLNWVWSVAWSPDGTRIASGGIRSVHLWTPKG